MPQHPSPDLPDFVSRHIGPTPADVAAMLEVVGQPSMDALVDAALPSAIRSSVPLALSAAASESAVIGELRDLAGRNRVLRSMIGLGYYGTISPPVVTRKILENPAWYTAYTPYQPEISQGRLEALLNFQTVVCDLTGLSIAGASLLDEGTAAAEAMTLMRRSTKVPDDAVLLVDRHTFPQTVAVVQTRARPLGITVVLADLSQVTAMYLAHREERLDQVRGALKALGEEASARQVVEHVYTDVDQKLWDAAEKSVQAQLDYLRTA